MFGEPAAMAVPASLTWAMTGTRLPACSTVNVMTLRRSASVRLTDSPQCIGTASASAPWST
jgi:hypothetical protein